jgi:hypothetical protein
MPQSGNADVIVTDLTTNFVTVGPNGSASFLLENLAGAARLGFDFHEQMTVIDTSRVVSALKKQAMFVLKRISSFVVPAGLGKTMGPDWGRFCRQ